MRRELNETRRIMREHGPLAVARKAVHYLYRMYLLAPYYRWWMARHADRVELEEAIELVFTGPGKLLTPAQIRSEVESFFELAARIKPRTVVEIGTLGGGMLFLFSRVAAPDARLISLDLRGGLFGGGYPGWRAPLYRAFARTGQTLELVRGDSHDPLTLERVRALLAGDAIDLLFIDGDHSYQGVKQDLEMYGPLVSASGLIGFHDIVPTDPGEGIEVSRLWAELRQEHEHAEFIAARDQLGFGIGVIRTPHASGQLAGFESPAAAR